MISRPSLIALPPLTSPTSQTLFIVRDQGVDQTLTLNQTTTLLNTKGDKGPQGPRGYLGSTGAQGSAPNSIKVVASQLDFNSTSYIYINGTAIVSGIGRGHTLIVYNPATSTIVSGPTTFDTYGSGTATLVAAINAAASGNIIILTTWDASQCDVSLRSALQGCGSPLVSTWSASRISHAFIGKKGSRIGTAYESTGSGGLASSVQTQVAYFTDSGPVLNGATGYIGSAGADYSSDQRLKTNIEIINDGLEKVSKINGVLFNWNDLAVSLDSGKDLTSREPGVIAQQIQEVLPEAVSTRENGYLAVRYEKIIPLLIEAIKDLRTEIQEIKKKL